MAPIDSQIKRGSAEFAILAVLAAQPLHGYDIAKQIEHRTCGTLRFKLASLYPLLYRLEKRGWVKARWDTGPNRRSRRYYRLTAAGQKHLRPLHAQWTEFFRALTRLAEEAHV